MKSVIALALAGLFVPALASAHPHMWISQQVRAVAKDGKYTHVEIEWRFDPFSSEVEIPLIDEDHDGKFSPKEIKVLAGEMLPELKTYGFMSWINTGAKDFRPSKPPEFRARIDDPASFMPADWNRAAGDSGMAMPPNKRAGDPSVPAGCRLAKHPSYKAEFIRGYPVFADIVTCQLP